MTRWQTLLVGVVLGVAAAVASIVGAVQWWWTRHV